MLKVTDFGCNEHNQHQLTLDGVEAKLMEDILYNLPKQGDFHTFICAQGNTHRISFQFPVPVEKLKKVSARPFC